jgi:hypothetical protein
LRPIRNLFLRRLSQEREYLKTYSGERIPGTVNYHVYVTEGNGKREILLDHHLKIKELVPEDDLNLRTELSYHISLAILIDFTGEIATARAFFRDFKNNMERLFSEDHWLLHSNRIEGFLKAEAGNEEEIADYTFFKPLP